MLIDLTGRVTVITAGATKAGRVFAQEFAKSGSDIVITYLPFQKEQAEETKKEIEALGKRCLTVEADFNHMDQVENIVAQTENEFGRLDVLIHNASTTHVLSVDELSDDEWDESNRVIVKAPVWLTRAASKVMMKNKYGRVIAIGGNSFYECDPIVTAHGNAKVGLCKAMQSLAVEYSPYITCNAINMAQFFPKDEATGFNKRQSDVGKKAYAKLGGIYEINGREYQGLDVYGVAEFLIFLAGCRPSCAISGDVIPMDGGMGLNRFRY